jgi:hypothetical protein
MIQIMHERDSRNFPIRENMRFQRATWIVERLGWACIAMIPVLGLSGIFANGILSHQRLQPPGHPLSVEYERFQRVTALTKFTARLTDPDGEEAHLRLSNAFQENYEIDSIQPRPSRSTGSPGDLDLFFERPESGEVEIVIWARPREFGLFDLTAASDRGEPLKFSVIVYP